MGEARHSNLERDMCDTYCIRCIMKRIVESGVAASASGVTSYASGVTTFASSVTAFASGVTAFAGRPTFRQIHFGPNGFRPMLFSSYPGFVNLLSSKTYILPFCFRPILVHFLILSNKNKS